jgi:cation diffusion facilitator family transporter
MKMVVGIMGGSVSILSETIHSSIDLIAALIAFFSVSKSDSLPDKDHPFGHGKVENISGVIEAILILVASILIVVEAIKKIITPHVIESIGIGFVVMFVSAFVNFLVSRRLYKVAQEEHSVALEADALHLKADVITSLGVGLGLCAIWVAGLFGLNLSFLDPVIAIAVAAFITKEAIVMLLKAFWPLIDTSLPDEDCAVINLAIAKFHPGNGQYHQLRTRKSGKHRHIDFHLNLPANMSVEQAHIACDAIEREIETRLSHTIVVIHVEPEGHA